jgi:hypothetical protein
MSNDNKRVMFDMSWVAGVYWIFVPTDKYPPRKLIEFEPFNPDGYSQGTIMEINDD